MKNLKKHKGFSELIIVIGIILLALALLLVFNTKIRPKAEQAITNTESQLEKMDSWSTGVTP